MTVVKFDPESRMLSNIYNYRVPPLEWIGLILITFEARRANAEFK